MADAFTGEIRAFAFNYPPQNWAFCNGQQMQIAENPVLYTVIGTLYGGDGKTTFKLPNLQGYVLAAIGSSPSAALPLVKPGDTTGEASVKLYVTQIANHNHSVIGYNTTTSSLMNNANEAAYLSRTFGQFDFSSASVSNTTMHSVMIGPAGGGAAHENRQPYIVMNYCICTYGEYPVPPQESDA
jgi:microcystin-dependent protein